MYINSSGGQEHITAGVPEVQCVRPARRPLYVVYGIDVWEDIRNDRRTRDM